MSSRLWLNLGLLVLVGVLVLLVVYEPGKEAPPQPATLTTLLPEQVHHILITRQNDEPIELEKTGAQWWMRRPWPLPANDFRVQSLLRLLQAETPGPHDLARFDRTRFGLDQPLATVTFNRELSIEFGATTPLQQRRYLAVGNQLHTLFDSFYYQVAGKPVVYLSQALLPPGANIEKLVLPELTLTRQNGNWRITPPRTHLSADAPVELVDQWRTVQALSVRPVDKPAGKADIEITLQGQPEPLRFRLRQSGESATLTRMDPGLEYTLAPDKLAQLLTLPAPPAKAGEEAAAD